VVPESSFNKLYKNDSDSILILFAMSKSKPLITYKPRKEIAKIDRKPRRVDNRCKFDKELGVGVVFNPIVGEPPHIRSETIGSKYSNHGYIFEKDHCQLCNEWFAARAAQPEVVYPIREEDSCVLEEIDPDWDSVITYDEFMYNGLISMSDYQFNCYIKALHPSKQEAIMFEWRVGGRRAAVLRYIDVHRS